MVEAETFKSLYQFFHSRLLKNEVYDVKIFWKGWIDCSKGSPGAGLFNIHTSGGWAEMAGNHPCTNIGGQTFNTDGMRALDVPPISTSTYLSSPWFNSVAAE